MRRPKTQKLRREAMERIALPSEVLERIVTSARRAVNVAAIYIFGSYARGDQHPDSDIDIYVVTPDAEKSRHDAVVSIGTELFGLGMARDVLAASPDSFAQRTLIPGSVESDVAQEGVLIYG